MLILLNRKDEEEDNSWH